MEVKFLKERGKSGVGTLHYNGSDQYNLEWGNGEKWLKKWGSTNGSFASFFIAIWWLFAAQKDIFKNIPVV